MQTFGETLRKAAPEYIFVLSAEELLLESGATQRYFFEYNMTARFSPIKPLCLQNLLNFLELP